ncbi:MAG: hypothetical protein IJU63_02640 [Bacteroidales bacterium]|nr:hypothetical protein [Bacteroidales bacterium]
MKKILLFAASLLLLASCEEWEPVLAFKYDAPAPEPVVTMTPTHTIAQLCKMYDGAPLRITQSLIISGVVVSDDQPGNFYKTLYIQDETGGIEVKIGRNSLYNLYRPGQTLFVQCNELCLGMYGFKSGTYGGQGMIQIGATDPTGEYETSYLESPLLVDAHVFKGAQGPLVNPIVPTEAQLPKKSDTQVTNSLIGKYVTIKGLTYDNEIFCLLYLDSTKDKKAATNNVFLSDTNPASDPTHGITTWAMSKNRMTQYLQSGRWDACEVARGNDHTGVFLKDLRGDGTYPEVEKNAYSVSHNFVMDGGKTVVIRTSGFSKFGDLEIPKDVLNGSRKINVTGILTMYQGSIQMTVNSEKDFTYEDGTPLYN